MNKREKKILIYKTARILTQIMFFIILPALYIQAFNGMKQLYLALIGLNFTSALLPQLIEVIAIIPITILLGRFFCGWMCAFGAFTDFIYLLSDKMIKSKWRIKKEVDGVLMYLKYIILGIVVLVMWSSDTKLFHSASPWDAFGMLLTVGKMPDLSYVISYLFAGFLIFLGIMIGSVLIERFFCRYLCPLGAVFAIVSKLRIGKINKPRTKCGNCTICTNACAMGIPLNETDVVKSSECINCMKCVAACPRGNTCYAIADNSIRSLVISTASVAVITAGYYSMENIVNTAGVFNSGSSQVANESNQVNKIYNDGVYQGTGTGFRNGTTIVSVTIENDEITNVETVSHEDDKPFYDRASNIVFDEILSNQSADVDAVSGATYSSNGIMEAVANALSSAYSRD